MLISAAVVTQACKNDVNGMQKRATVAAAAAAAPPQAEAEDPDDDDLSFIGADDEPCDEEWDDPAVVQPQTQRPQLRRGQALVRGELRGTGTGKPLLYEPRPLPPLPDLPE